MRRPTFFLSSTIYDFKDLRSAVKYLLEQQGCVVLASEYNDFPKPLDTHSYEACLNALKQADYFVLFVGARVGGWYDKEARISITQAEYREAYKMHLKGKLKLINFVRADVWRHREDRKELATFLDNIDLDPGLSTAIKNFPSKSANDANFITNFISEICRNKETKDAIKESSPLPTGNWMHIFETFRDVADVIQTQVFSGLPIENVTLRRLLLRETREILRISLIRLKDGNVLSPICSIERFHGEHQLKLESTREQVAVVNTKRWDTLSILSIHAMGAKYNTLIIQRALESPVFLAFDLASGEYKEEPVYEALAMLNDEIRRFNLVNTTENMRIVFENTKNKRALGQQTISLDTLKLLSLLHLLDRWINIIELSRSVILFLQGAPFTMPKLRPKSPIQDIERDLEQERVTREELDTYIKVGG